MLRGSHSFDFFKPIQVLFNSSKPGFNHVEALAQDVLLLVC